MIMMMTNQEGYYDLLLLDCWVTMIMMTRMMIMTITNIVIERPYVPLFNHLKMIVFQSMLRMILLMVG